VINEVLREVKDEGRGNVDYMTGESAPKELPPFALDATSAKLLAELVKLIDAGTISGKIAKDIFPEVMKQQISPAKLVADRGLVQVTDTSSIVPAVDSVLAKNPDAIAAYKSGKTNVVGFLVGQVMKETGGKASPKLVNQLLVERLSR
jgi:Asp-tRNA(Asn)/Glu-tRNA(Gln) amidotransferase B subunit